MLASTENRRIFKQIDTEIHILILQATSMRPGNLATAPIGRS